MLQGISYTQFSYGELDVRPAEGKGSFTVMISVTNIGSFAGKETPQLYLRFALDAGEPPKQLKGFAKTETLAPGSSELVTFSLVPRDMSIWDVGTHGFVLSVGEFELMVGASSCDIRQRTTVNDKPAAVVGITSFSGQASEPIVSQSLVCRCR